MSAVRIVWARWRLIGVILAFEYALGWLIGTLTTRLAGPALPRQPEGAGALFLPGGIRLAIELGWSRERELVGALAIALVTVTAYGTFSVFLAAVLARAFGAPASESTATSALVAGRKIPAAVALALLALLAYASLGGVAWLSCAAVVDATGVILDPRWRAALVGLSALPFALAAVCVLAWHDRARAHLVIAPASLLDAAREGIQKLRLAGASNALTLCAYLLAGTAIIVAGGALDATLASHRTSVIIAVLAQLVALGFRALIRAHWLARVTVEHRDSTA